MRLNFRIPRYASSTVEVQRNQGSPVLDRRDVIVENSWDLPAHTVAVAGRRAVWFGLDILGRHWELDVGGHLFLIVTGADASRAALIEAGPMHPNGTGGLVPFDYPEATFARQSIADFKPAVIPPPHGVTAEVFADWVRGTQRDYDGDQRYLAIELPFLRVGRDSNSYTVGVLLSCCLDPRSIARTPENLVHRELTGYPGAEDPVHRENFGRYFGMPVRLSDGGTEVAYHYADGSVFAVVVGGAPNGNARLPDGTTVALDHFGRIVFSPDDARRHHLPSVHTDPPPELRDRRFFPAKPAPGGAQICLIVDRRVTQLAPHDEYRGTIVDRDDALGFATLRTDTSDVILPMTELGVEMRDPQRVDRLLKVGNVITVGLHRDRHPKLILHGAQAIADRFIWRRFHAPRLQNIIGTAAATAAVAGIALLFFRFRQS